MSLKWADSSLTPYVKFSPRDTRADQNKGKADAKRDYPPSDAHELSVYELQLMSEGNGSLTKFARHRDQELDRLEHDLARQEHERDQGFKAKRDGLQSDKDSAIENLRTTHGPMSALQTGLSARHSEKKATLQRIELDLNRPLRVHFVRAYPFFLTFLSLAEVPVNKLAFEFFFQEAPIIALLIALMVGVLLIALAHVCGLWLRQAHHHRNWFGVFAAYAGTVVVFAIVGCLIYFIAALRQQFVDFIETEQSFNLSEFLQSGQLAQAATNLGTVELGNASLTLLAINLAIFVFGVILSFMRHDPHPDYEKATRDRDRAERKLHRVRIDFDRRQAAIEQEFDGKITYLDKAINDLEAQIADLGVRISTVKGSSPEAEKLVRQVILQRILAYQAGNTEIRKSTAPKYFGNGTEQWISERVLIP